MRVNKFVMPIVAIVALLGTVGQTDILMGPHLASDALIVCQGATKPNLYQLPTETPYLMRISW